MAKAREKPTTARIRTLLRAHVDWLRGVPLSIEDGAISWLVLPRSERDSARTIRVDGGTISQATRCVHELLREPDTLARVVGDVDAFRTRVFSALARLKPSVHHGAAVAVDDLVDTLPAGVARRARQLLAEHRALAEMVLFAYALDPGELRGALGALEQYADVLAWLLARDDRPSCFAVLRIAVEDGARADALFSFVREALETSAPCCDRDKLVESFPISPAPSPSMIPVRPKRETPAGKLDALPKLFTWLAPRDNRTRRAALAIVAASAPIGIFRRWADARAELAALDERFRKRKEWPSDAPLVSELRRLRERLPHSFELAPYVDAVCTLAEAPFSDALVRTFPVVPEYARARYAVYWAEVARWIDESARPAIPDYLAAFREYLANTARSSSAEGRLAPWKTLLVDLEREVRRWHAPDHELIDSLRRKDAFRRFFAALGAMTTTPAVSPLDELIAVGMDPRAAADRADAMAGLQEPIYPSKRALQLAHELEPKTATEFVVIAGALATDGGASLVNAWARLGRLDAATIATLRRTFVHSPHEIARAGHMLSIVRDVPPLVRSHARSVPAWVRRYPPELHAALARLSEETAARVLEKDFPSDAGLKQQIDALEARGPSSRSRARIATLRGRLGAERKLSRQRIANLVEKLERAADRTMWNDWLARLRDATAKTIARLLDVEACPAWALEDANLAAIASALALESQHRELALRLFRVRAGLPPWDLRDAPENVAVLRDLRARGIDPAPWVDGIGVIERDGVFLSLENDPLEIFQMGERFATCLSVGASNYFSVFANAADIDKRVLYARDKDGKPLGRCLLALSEDGHVLTFHAYAHEGSDHIGRLFAEFATTLAERMGAVCAPRGRVRPRVAKDWYDDGPRDLAAQFPFLEDYRSLFRIALAKVSEDDVIELARDAFDPRPLDGLTIPLVLALDEVKRRPTLALPLLHLLVEPRAPLSTSLRILAADLAHRAGDRERARVFAGGALLAEIEDGFRGDPDHVNERCVELQLDLDPAALLALTRRLARRTPKMREDEARLYIAARALERMGRLRRALTIYDSLALNQSHRSEAIDVARERIQARLGRG